MQELSQKNSVQAQDDPITLAQSEVAATQSAAAQSELAAMHSAVMMTVTAKDGSVQQTSFVKSNFTYEELWFNLPADVKEYYMSLKAIALKIPKCISRITKGFERTKSGQRMLIEFRIRRGTLYALFEVENETVVEYVGKDAANAVQKVKVALNSEEGYERAVRLLYAVKAQLERDEIEKKAARAQMRRLRRLEKIAAEKAENSIA